MGRIRHSSFIPAQHTACGLRKVEDSLPIDLTMLLLELLTKSVTPYALALALRVITLVFVHKMSD